MVETITTQPRLRLWRFGAIFAQVSFRVKLGYGAKTAVSLRYRWVLERFFIARRFFKRMLSNKLSSGLTGVSGEYFVAAELSRRGYVTSITLRNTRGIDILVSNSNATRQVAIQVKTTQKTKSEWVLNKKAETFYSDALFYVFVCLGSGESRPEYYIVPSKAVADFVTSSHRKWLETPGKQGQPHKDNPVRRFQDDERQYLNRWDLLGLDDE